MSERVMGATGDAKALFEMARQRLLLTHVEEHETDQGHRVITLMRDDRVVAQAVEMEYWVALDGAELQGVLATSPSLKGLAKKIIAEIV